MESSKANMTFDTAKPAYFVIRFNYTVKGYFDDGSKSI